MLARFKQNRAMRTTDDKMINCLRGRTNIIDVLHPPFFFKPQVWEQALNKIKGGESKRPVNTMDICNGPLDNIVVEKGWSEAQAEGGAN